MSPYVTPYVNAGADADADADAVAADRRMSADADLDRVTAGSDHVVDMQAMEHWKTAVK